jgi:tetratricopeptide (TPR) repeat protein
MRLWIRLIDDTPPEPSDLVQRALKYVTSNRGEEAYVVGSALLRAGRLDEAVGRFQQSLAVQPDWPNHGLNAYGLALAHHRLGHPDDACRWLDIGERWLDRLDRIYKVEAPSVLTGQPQTPVSFEFWVYAEFLRRATAGPILDKIFPADPFAR